MLKIAIIRGLIPFIIMSLIPIIMALQKIDKFQVKSTFLVGIIISVVAAASTIYDIRSWSLLKQSLIHFLLMTITIFPCLLISGWFKLNSMIDYVKVFCIFLLVGIILWGLGYFIFGKILYR